MTTTDRTPMERFAAANRIHLASVSLLAENPNNPGDDWQADHFGFWVVCDKGQASKGTGPREYFTYSTGIGHRMTWRERQRAKDTHPERKVMKTLGEEAATERATSRADYEDRKRKRYVMSPDVGSVLECLAMDARTARDYPTIEEYADSGLADCSDLAGSLRTFNALQDGARKMRAVLGGLFDAFLEIEEE